MKLKKKYVEVLESLGWKVSSENPDDGTVEIENWSPAGEDLVLSFMVEDFPQEVHDCALYFDADEHIEMWVREKMRGRDASVPSIRELVEDADAIQSMLDELAAKLLDAQNNK